MPNQNTKKIPAFAVVLFNCTGDMGMDIFGYLKNSFSLFYFCFVRNLPKKFMACVRF